MPDSPSKRARASDRWVFPGLLDAKGLGRLAAEYRRATGMRLEAIAPDGALLPSLRPSSRDPGFDQMIRRQALSEALRWGDPCVLCDAQDRLLWAVPVLQNQELCGGLLVSGVQLQAPRKAGQLDRRVMSACARLLELAAARNLTNTALLAERRQAARREREKAEAVHSLKDRLYDDIRSIYLREEPALLAAIRRGERAEARNVINRVLTAIYMQGRSRVDLLKSLVLELVVMMTRAAVQAGGDPEKILGLNYQSLTSLSRLVDQEDLSVWLCDMLESLIDAISVKVRHPNAVQLARALEYMEERLGRELGRSEVAAAAGLSPSHFSRLMRAKTGWTFTELVTRLRVDKACQLLLRSEADLTRIALECGFGDQSYFNRVFRKRTGRTPGDYRRGQQAQDGSAGARKSKK